MNNEKKSLISENNSKYTMQNALDELDELKNIALNCIDKNGNPNLSIAVKAIEIKAKIAGLYSKNIQNNNTFVKMNEIKIDGEQLKLNIGEDLNIL